MGKGRYKLAREKLFEMRTLKSSLDNLTDMIHEIDDKLDGYKPLNMEGMPSGGNKPNYFREKLIDEKTRYEEIFKRSKEELYLLRLPLKQLDDFHKMILECFYIEGKSRDFVCEKLNLSYSTFYREKCKALEEYNIILELIAVK